MKNQGCYKKNPTQKKTPVFFLKSPLEKPTHYFFFEKSTKQNIK